MNTCTTSSRRDNEFLADPFQDPVAYLASLGIDADLVEWWPPGLTTAA